MAAWHTCGELVCLEKTRPSMSANERGSHLCRVCEQNQQWLSGATKPDSVILGLQTGANVKKDYA
ncbi:MAG: hypothetical protein ACLP2X_13690 [Syntrophobacteraceae bacterium]